MVAVPEAARYATWVASFVGASTPDLPDFSSAHDELKPLWLDEQDWHSNQPGYI